MARKKKVKLEETPEETPEEKKAKTAADFLEKEKAEYAARMSGRIEPEAKENSDADEENSDADSDSQDSSETTSETDVPHKNDGEGEK